MRFELVVIGVSAGGVELLLQLLPRLSGAFPVPVMVCLHAGPGFGTGMATMLAGRSRLAVRVAADKDPLAAGTVLLAPGGYHSHIERDRSVSLSLDPPVRFARPSIDVLFESAAHVFGPATLAVVLSGANNDGADGVRAVKAAGGTVIVQDPATAEVPDMPRAALAAVQADFCVAPDELPQLLTNLCQGTA